MKYILLIIILMPFNLFAIDWFGLNEKDVKKTPEKLNEKLFDQENESFTFFQRDGSLLIIKKSFLKKEVVFAKTVKTITSTYKVDFYNTEGEVVLSLDFKKASFNDFIKAVFGNVLHVKTK